ncbi:MAG: DUF131 domain-containing protein [Candidatus Bathyarchaeia archaeon]
MNAPEIIAVGWILITAGIIILITTIMTVVFRATKRQGSDRLRGGGLIMLGPIPIIFGTDKETVKALIILAIILIVVMLAFILIINALLATKLGGL